MKVSVIIPVYNVARYLDQCIQSVLVQTHQQFELILVDDGSTDQSLTICNQYADTDPRVMVFHQMNQGVSAARNKGIKEASGDFLYFVDGDDYIHEETLVSFIEVLEKNPGSEFILGRMSFFEDGSSDAKPDSYVVENSLVAGKRGQQAFIDILSNQKRMRMGVRGLYKRDYIINHDLFFGPENYAEDIEWTVRLFIPAKEISSNTQPHYFYRAKRAGSITNTLKLAHAESLIRILLKWEEVASGPEILPEFKQVLLKECGKRYFRMFKKFGRFLPEKDRRAFYRNIRESRHLIRYAPYTVRNLLTLSISICGVETTSKLLVTIENLRSKKHHSQKFADI